MHNRDAIPLLEKFIEQATEYLRADGVTVAAEHTERAAAHAAYIHHAYTGGDRSAGLAALVGLALREATGARSPLTPETVRDQSPPVLAAPDLAEAAPDGAQRIKFLAEERATYEVIIETDYLDERIPAWRAVLADPDNHGAPGRADLETAIWEGMQYDDQLGGHARFKLVPMDREPVRFRLNRTDPDGTTAVHDVAVPADLLDAHGFHWRDLVGRDRPVTLSDWEARLLAELTAAQLGGRTAARLEVRSTTR